MRSKNHQDRSEFAEVTVVIPALNEQDALPLVLRDLPQVGSVIVADNGSTDRTAEVALEAGAIVVDQPQRGYGSACLAGLAEVERRIGRGKPAPRVIVFLDADYSDHPEQLPELVAPIFEGRAEFVLGSRIVGEREPGAMPPQSLYGNRLACWLMRLFFGAHYTDLGPFRAISYVELCRLEMSDTNFGWTIEMQIKATKARLRTLEVPVRYRRRVGTSKISGTVRGTILAGSKILYTIAKYGLSSESRGKSPEPGA
ncbi:MAG: glycosyltransferase family 2 protein [Planctomycetes bacterium]|nr:glycosyltransferase family 2 protein [Planctomycetota bacterium]